MRFRRLSPNIRFIEGDAVEGGEEAVDSAPAEAPESEAPKGNPAWEEFRSQLDPISFSKIEPILAKQDQSVQQRIQSTNASYEPWKALADQGVTPETVNYALGVMQYVDENPVELFEYLEKFLNDTGRMPSREEVQDASAAGEIGEEEAPQYDPRIDELAQQQEQMREFLEYQQQQAEAHEAEVALDNEISAFKTAHADVSDADLKEILGRTALIAQQNFAQGKQDIPSLEEVYSGWFTELRTRLLSSPRPGDSAPKLLPTSGGLPSSAPAKGLGQMSRQDVQDFIASAIASENTSGR